MKRSNHVRATWAVAAALTLLAACTVESTTAALSHAAASSPATGDVAPVSSERYDPEKDIATLRAAVAPFHRFGAAKEAGWSAKITSCMADKSLGGMGFHYGNVSIIDGSVQVDRPELLLYEPQSNGQLRLVAVEYIIPYTFHARDAEAPVLFGKNFSRNDRFQLWGLHAWVGARNPSGMFASWNPRVNCENTTDLDVAPMTH